MACAKSSKYSLADRVVATPSCELVYAASFTERRVSEVMEQIFSSWNDFSYGKSSLGYRCNHKSNECSNS